MYFSTIRDICNIAIQFLYITGILSVLIAKFVPELNGFLKYGKTLDSVSSRYKIINYLLNLQVPKYYFYHFYILSLLLSSLNSVLTNIAIRYDYKLLNSTTSANMIPANTSRLVTFLILLHSLRRLLESLFLMNHSKTAYMNISHYLVGIFFYSALNLNIFLNTSFEETKVEFSFRTLLPFLLFFFGMVDQFMNHLHLSHVPKYKTPTYGLFKFISCAHYFDELMIYLSISMLLQNLSSYFCVAFVFVNLSASAVETRRYYKHKNDGKVQKWSIIPFVL